MSLEFSTEKILKDIMNQNNFNLENQLNQNLVKHEQLVPAIIDSTTNNDYSFGEQDILYEVEKDFSYQIRQRGEDYYDNGNVILCCKNGNVYYAKVRGTDDKPYTVNVEVTENGVHYDCTCPCNFPCKHEYAVLMMIANQEYTNANLKPKIKEKKDTLQNILKQIPADEIKDYLLSSNGLEYVYFEMQSFEEHFRKYYPIQSYEYYYNNLFNALVVDDDYENMVLLYINKIRQYITNQEFIESFKILKSIINAYHDTNKLNFDAYIMNEFPNLGMLLRIIYRKSNPILKEEIRKWIDNLEKEKYYNNIYLEDIVIMINFGEESI